MEHMDMNGNVLRDDNERRKLMTTMIVGIFAQEKCTVAESKRILDEARSLIEDSTVQARMSFSEAERLSALMQK